MARSLKRFRPLFLGLTLAVVSVIGVACAPAGSPTAASTPLSTPAATPLASLAAPTNSSVAQLPAPDADMPVGVDAEGNFYRGDINAPVRLTEYSDFQ